MAKKSRAELEILGSVKIGADDAARAVINPFRKVRGARDGVVSKISRVIKDPSRPYQKKPRSDGTETTPRLTSVFEATKSFMTSQARMHDLTTDDLAEISYQTAAYFTAAPELPTVPTEVSPPEAAPELWASRDLNRRESPPQFIRRVYSDWLGHGLQRRHLVTLDPALYKALSVWLTRKPDDEIVGELPAHGHSTNDLIDRLSADYSLDDLRKLGYAINARLRRVELKNRQ